MKKRRMILIFPLVILGVLLLLAGSCKKKDNSTPSPASNTITDIDGNVYHTVSIGTQVWTVENLKTTRYNNGVSIPLVSDNTAWGTLVTPGYCWMNNDINYKSTYGALYNWYVVNTGKLAPAGWHVPSDAEWTLLTNFLGGLSVAGGKMKSTGTIEAATGLWYSPNTDATNESGFSGLPGSVRDNGGPFLLINIGDFGNWWSSTQINATDAWAIRLNNYDGAVYRSDWGTSPGFSVRCVKD
jgi:uncharacterized protein (TIGR02145 family)